MTFISLRIFYQEVFLSNAFSESTDRHIFDQKNPESRHKRVHKESRRVHIENSYEAQGQT